MALKYVDMIALSRVEDGTVAEHVGSLERLIEAGLMEADGRLTEQGQDLFEKLKKKEEMLRAGIPAERRTKGNKKAFLDGDYHWTTGRVSNQPIVTNGEVIYVGKPIKAMELYKAPASVKKKSCVA